MPNHRIKQFRLLKNLTQEHVALEANISQSQLSKYESGESVPKADMLRKIAKALNSEVFEFFYATENDMKEAFERWQLRK